MRDVNGEADHQHRRWNIYFISSSPIWTRAMRSESLWIDTIFTSFRLLILMVLKLLPLDYSRELPHRGVLICELFYVGFSYTQTNERLWRKNRQILNSTTPCGARDINRNWPFQYVFLFLVYPLGLQKCSAHKCNRWNGTTGASVDPCSQTYKGKSFSCTLLPCARQDNNTWWKQDCHQEIHPKTQPWGHTIQNSLRQLGYNSSSTGTHMANFSSVVRFPFPLPLLLLLNPNPRTNSSFFLSSIRIQLRSLPTQPLCTPQNLPPRRWRCPRSLRHKLHLRPILPVPLPVYRLLSGLQLCGYEGKVQLFDWIEGSGSVWVCVATGADTASGVGDMAGI